MLNALILFLNVNLLPIEERKAIDYGEFCDNYIDVKNYLTIDAIVETFEAFKHMKISMSVSQKKRFFHFHHANIFGGILKALIILKRNLLFWKILWKDKTLT